MKQFKRLFLLFLITLFSTSFLRAQTGDSLGISYISPGYPQCPDTAFTGQVYDSIIVLVVNYRNFPFTGILSVNFKTYNDVLATDSLINNGGQLTTIGANDTLTLFISNYTFSTNVYRLGSSVVVVWPMSNNVGYKFDSTFTCLNLESASGLHDPDLNPRNVFPNPAFHTLNLSSAIQKITEKVRIYDFSGRLLYDDHLKGPSIPVGFLNSGMYILEIKSRNNLLLRKQFLKE